MIYFYDSAVAKTLEAIKDARDCADILNDLNRIEQAKAGVNLYDNTSAAKQLHKELREKYPYIDVILNFVDTMLPPSPRTAKVYSESEAVISALTQDYYGILCDTVVKKEIVQGMKQFIKSVD